MNGPNQYDTILSLLDDVRHEIYFLEEEHPEHTDTATGIIDTLDDIELTLVSFIQEHTDL